MHHNASITLEFWETKTDGTHVVEITRVAGIAISIRQVGWLWGIV